MHISNLVQTSRCIDYQNLVYVRNAIIIIKKQTQKKVNKKPKMNPTKKMDLNSILLK